MLSDDGEPAVDTAVYIVGATSAITLCGTAVVWISTPLEDCDVRTDIGSVKRVPINTEYADKW